MKTCPFTILVDSAEGQPYTFDGIHCDSPSNDKIWSVSTQYACLGRHPNGLGDYSIDGMVGRVHVERKSGEDAVSTILGFSGRRGRFAKELENLAKIEAGLVMIECDVGYLLEGGRRTDWGSSRSRQTIAKQIDGSLLAFMQDFHVPWFFAMSRRHAEIATFRFLRRFWKNHHKE